MLASLTSKANKASVAFAEYVTLQLTTMSDGWFRRSFKQISFVHAGNNRLVYLKVSHYALGERDYLQFALNIRNIKPWKLVCPFLQCLILFTFIYSRH